MLTVSVLDALLASGLILEATNQNFTMNNLLNILLQADGQIYNRSWIIWFVILIIVAGGWFAWHRNRQNVKKSEAQGKNPDGEVIV